MAFEGLKRYMPRGIYGRAALILVLPVVTLQLVISIVFIQRHFEDVAVQLTTDSARAVSYALSIDDPEAAASALDFSLRPVDEEALPDQDLRRWYDFSALVVMRTLRERLQNVERIAIPDDSRVWIYLRREGQLFEVALKRGRVAASNPHQLLVHMVFFGALTTVIAYLYLRNQLRPITRLAHAAQAFGRGRHVPYTPGGAVEVRTAGHAFLDMRARIERQIEQRTMMLSGISHDLRTPLTRLRLGLSLLDDDEREPLERDVDEMQRLIDAFLDFARGDAETGPAEPVDPVALASCVVDDARRAGQPVELGVTEGQGVLPLRSAAIRRAIENLVTNAVRYGTRCRVSVRLTERSLRIRVEDDGPGIPPEDRPEAVRPFVRLDPARNQDRGSGVGLGLAIAADVARAHGGVLRLTDSATLGGLCVDIVIGR
ncbi:ATP-binding protein [Citreimonas salinaria]|uniref:histidine kinase n=1 Tax=Citreimonas salinaria TaxID=321339 RepID=A0A1H3IFE3_9RHOB|nr:ATP-binding protein [Citreimonas salinaria]SDY26105.1 two-component system, OmpR family, osmolarity sensor histidine kinase EnvZ [Citreimonas salinaria]